MKLTHLGVSYYRSIGAEPVTIDLSKKITVLVGANNCGKSNVLRALEEICEKGEMRRFAEVDLHRRNGTVTPCFHFGGEHMEHDALRMLQSLGRFEVQQGGARQTKKQFGPVVTWIVWTSEPSMP